MKKYFQIVLICLISQAVVFSATYTVGAGKTYADFTQVPALSGGDIVEIYGGTYNKYKTWSASGSEGNPIIIRGMSLNKPVVDGTGLVLRGDSGVPRALFEFWGSHYIIENLEFKNAYNGSYSGSYNGAGIRIVEGTDITIRNCKITKCENGMMSSTTAGKISVEYCEIGDNGDSTNPTPGYAHNFYMMGESIRVIGCYIHDSTAGHNFKSRMHYNELLYNYIVDANSAEVDFV